MQAYHDSDSLSSSGYSDSAVRESPDRRSAPHSSYIHVPTHELVRREFCARHPIGALIEDAVRSIAARIGRSSGAISPALKRLAKDGWISYLSDGRGTLIEVLRSDREMPPIDQQTDRSVLPPALIVEAESASGSDESPFPIDQESDRSVAALGCDQESDRSACMVDHDSCSNSSSSMRASGEKNDWSTITIAGLDFLPTRALEHAGVTPQSFLEADRKIGTRREYDRPAQVRILIRSLLTHQPIYSASELARRTEEMHHVPAAAPNGRDGAGARRQSRTHSHPRYALAPEPNAERDAEFAAMRAEFERIAHTDPRCLSRL